MSNLALKVHTCMGSKKIKKKIKDRLECDLHSKFQGHNLRLNLVILSFYIGNLAVVHV